MDLTTPKTKECWRCQIELRGDGEYHQRHCPRCAHDLEAAPIDIGNLSDPHERNSWILAMDLASMYKNWATAHIRVMVERGEADYSALEDFAVEVLEQSFPYLQRLLKEKLLNTACVDYLRGVLDDATLRILAEADKLYLEGGEREEDRKLREYWLKRLAFTNRAIAPYSSGVKALCYKGADS